MSRKKIEFITPDGNVGKGLLRSIPVKVNAMLKLAGIKERSATWMGVKWDLRSKRIHLLASNTVICWSGPTKNPTSVWVHKNTDSWWFSAIEFHLDKFVAVEQAIYTAIEVYCINQNHDDKGNLPPLPATVSQ